MYHELGLVEEFNINPIVLKRWLVSLSLILHVLLSLSDIVLFGFFFFFLVVLFLFLFFLVFLFVFVFMGIKIEMGFEFETQSGFVDYMSGKYQSRFDFNILRV